MMAVVMSPTNTSTPITIPTVAPVDSLCASGGMVDGSGGRVGERLAITTHDHSIYIYIYTFKVNFIRINV